MAIKHVLVTGAAGGIGREVVHGLAASGVGLTLVDKDKAGLAELAHRHPESVRGTFAVDLSDIFELERITQRELVGTGIDAIIHSAGISPKHGDVSQIAPISLAEWLDVLHINLSSFFVLCRGLIGDLQQSGRSRVVAISSQAGRTAPLVAGTHYAASKSGLIGVIRCLARELGPFGGTANAVAPGRIESPMMSVAGRKSLSEIPAGRLGTTREVASVINYLCSVDAGFINGVSLDINGGHFIGA